MSNSLTSSQIRSSIPKAGVAKRRPRKSLLQYSITHVGRLLITDLIKAYGIDRVPCSCCLDKGYSCIINDSQSSKYSKCLRFGQSCDVASLTLDGVRRFLGDKARTDSDLRAAKA